LNTEKILVDKYFYKDNPSEVAACVNVTIFSSKGEIIDEIVVCEESEEKQTYKLLTALHSKIETQVCKVHEEQLTRIIDNITQSLEQLMPAR
jgi:hypothetical protein